MKHLIFLFIFAMAAMVATAQEPATDTSYIEFREGAFWRVTISQELISVDTAATVNAIIGEIYPRLEQYANAAVLTINLAKARKLIADAGQKLTALTGGNYYSQLDTDLGDTFLGDYSIKVDGGNGIAVSVIRAGGGTGGSEIQTRQYELHIQCCYPQLGAHPKVSGHYNANAGHRRIYRSVFGR